MLSELPICLFKDTIIDSVRNHYVTIVIAETGAGKSTKVPQFLMPYFDKVVTTEPRRMVAKTLAQRVACEMNTSCGELVGFQTAFERQVSSETKMIYCTDGMQVVMEILNNDTTLNRVIIIDEIHEWNINMEVLLALMKKMEGKWNTHVVIMSATLDCRELQQFFNDAAVIKVHGSTFPVKDEYQAATDREEQWMIIRQIVTEKVEENQNVLVFLPGKGEIESVEKLLQSVNAEIIILHGELEWEEQKKAFQKYDRPKVILATNVCQTSITIDDIDVVVDTGLARIKQLWRGIEGLSLENVSQYDLLQRRGRVGRTKPGTYILCSPLPFSNREERPIPEIMRSHLDRVCLQLAMSDIEVEELTFFHQPNMINILNAKEQLNKLGAMDGNHVTEIGKKMVKMPLSPQLSRMIVEAEKLGVVKETIILSAIVEMGGFFNRNTRLMDFVKKYIDRDYPPKKSDLLVWLDVWNYITSLGYIKNFDEFGINKKKFLQVKQYIKKLYDSLLGKVEISSHPDNDEAIIRAFIVGFGSNIYVSLFGSDEYRGNGSIVVKIDKDSAMIHSYEKIIAGKPITLKTESGQLNILTFVTAVTEMMLEELFPDQITENVEYSLSPASLFNPFSRVRITTTKFYSGIAFSTETVYAGKEHPMFQTVWNEYYNPENEWITIAGKEFPVIKQSYGYGREVEVDTKTLFEASEDECSNFFSTKTGERIKLLNKTYYASGYTLGELKRRVEEEYIFRLLETRSSANKRVGTFSYLSQMPEPIVLGKNHAGFGNVDIVAEPHLVIRSSSVFIEYYVRGFEPEYLEENPQKALRILYSQYVKTKYPDKRFSKGNFSKKGKRSLNNNGLNASEQQKRDDFYTFAKEMEKDLSIENIEDIIVMLEEYFNELMEG